MKRKKTLLLVSIFTSMLFVSCSNVDSKKSNPSYLETPVPYEVQRHFDEPVKWDKWRQEAWLRGDVKVDSLKDGSKFIIINRGKPGNPVPSHGVNTGIYD